MWNHHCVEAYNSILTARHRRTLARVFARPTPSDIRWTKVDSMLRAFGVEIRERSGSRVLLRKGADRIAIHRQHPQPEISRGSVRRLVEFLRQIGPSHDELTVRLGSELQHKIAKMALQKGMNIDEWITEILEEEVAGRT